MVFELTTDVGLSFEKHVCHVDYLLHTTSCSKRFSEKPSSAIRLTDAAL